MPRPLTKEEILHIVKKYGEATKRAQTAGFDAVEIHAAHFTSFTVSCAAVTSFPLFNSHSFSTVQLYSLLRSFDKYMAESEHKSM